MHINPLNAVMLVSYCRSHASFLLCLVLPENLLQGVGNANSATYVTHQSVLSSLLEMSIIRTVKIFFIQSLLFWVQLLGACLTVIGVALCERFYDAVFGKEKIN